LHQFEFAKQWRRRPVIEQHRFAATNRRADLGIQRSAGTAAEVGVVVLQAIRRELLLVDHFRGPADRAVEETPFARAFRVLEHVLVFLQISDTAQIRRQRFDAFGRVALDHVFRHPPAFSGALYRIAQTDDLALGFGLDPDRTAPGPLLANHLDVIVGQRGLKSNSGTRQGIGRQAVSFLDDHPQHLGDQATAFPVQVSKVDRRLCRLQRLR